MKTRRLPAAHAGRRRQKIGSDAGEWPEVVAPVKEKAGRAHAARATGAAFATLSSPYRSVYRSGSMTFRGGANTSISFAGRSDTTRAECTALGGITNAAPAGQSLLSPLMV